jgi:hypothetical protein
MDGLDRFGRFSRAVPRIDEYNNQCHSYGVGLRLVERLL